ncbi:amidase domain-containing protein [Salipaludibacillus sp. LMS25]|jgi:hypothetical protein|uniref:amidase domain-containing protein n=1 Tax=Salipaludibacillus sp. LMS25 TaxID=2924031 RepID=UPI0020D1F3AA|nr:amidase domain-containing protein [Salipaludibacillus sp. LMS25]UTR14782.1 amidase domain-containing protein [Salipaludibacillus sp. LMS25]
MSSYNRTKVAEYAKKSNPNHKRYDKNCTNFVSQAVNAGSKPEKKPSTVKNGITDSTTYWYNVYLASNKCMKWQLKMNATCRL